MTSSKVAKLKKIAREYHRHPKGAPGGVGGQFAPKNKTGSILKSKTNPTANKSPKIHNDLATIRNFNKIGGGMEGDAFLDRDEKVVYKINKGYRPLGVPPRPHERKFEKESIKLKKANDLGLGPKLLSYDKANNILAMEFINGEYSTIRDAESLDNQTRITIVKNIVSQMKTMHNGGIIHNDLHIGNIMTDKKGNVKLIDFGVADTFEKSTFNNYEFLSARMDEVTQFIGYIVYGTGDPDDEDRFFNNLVDSKKKAKLKELQYEISSYLELVNDSKETKRVNQFANGIYDKILNTIGG